MESIILIEYKFINLKNTLKIIKKNFDSYKI